MPVVIERVNRNSAAMTFLLRAIPATATGQFKKDNGQVEKFDVPAELVYRKPRGLYLKLDTLLGRMEIGSNEEEFWVWEKFDRWRYFWGKHALMDATVETAIPMRPDHLADVLGLGDLPTQTNVPLGPIFRVMPNRYELDFLARDMIGQLYYTKSIYVDRWPPLLVREIVYYRPDGKPYVEARLQQYEQIDGTEILAPRRVRIDSLDHGDWLELTFRKMSRFDDDKARKVEEKLIARSPRQRGEDVGVEQRVDRMGVEVIPPASMPEAPDEDSME